MNNVTRKQIVQGYAGTSRNSMNRTRRVDTVLVNGEVIGSYSRNTLELEGEYRNSKYTRISAIGSWKEIKARLEAI